MELDEIEKRLEWLDTERQKSVAQIKELKDKITNLETTVEKQKRKLETFENESKSLKNTANKISQMDESIAQMKTDLLKQISESEKKQGVKFSSIEKQQKDDLNFINKKYSEIQSILPQINEFKKNLQNRIDEESRLSQRIEKVEKQWAGYESSISEVTQNGKRNYDELQVEIKKLSDLQIELLSIRKRIDEDRTRNEIVDDTMKKFVVRLGEIEAAETERKQTLTAFTERINLSQIDRENQWKEWQKKIADVGSINDNYNLKIEELENTHRAIKKSQEELDDVNVRFNRRINELTEMHRLTEDRFRQEWVSFKTEDQKRWTNYLLTQEEKLQEDARQMSKLMDRIVTLEDGVQDTKDTIELINEETDKRLKASLSVIHDLIESFNQTFNKR